MISCNQTLIHGKKINLAPGSISIFIFIFIFICNCNCVLFKKLRKRSVDDVAFIKFDHNFNFVPDDILPDVVTRLRNQENCSPCRMDFLRNEIVDSLMEQ